MMKASGMVAMRNASTMPAEAPTLVARRRKLGRAAPRSWTSATSWRSTAVTSRPPHAQLGAGHDGPGHGVDHDGQGEQQHAQADEGRAVGARRLAPLEGDHLGDGGARVDKA